MKFADITEPTELSITRQNVETGQMNSTEPFSTASTLVVQSEQSVPAFEVERDDLTSFFAVGIVINIVMITAYFIWAYKQLKKTGTREE